MHQGSQNIIHRDLKPAKAFLTDAREIKTPLHIAPEILRDEYANYTAVFYFVNSVALLPGEFYKDLIRLSPHCNSLLLDSPLDSDHLIGS